MAITEIKRWTDGVVIASGEGTVSEVLSQVVKSYADLSYANLRYADLSSANLSYANLRYADLRSADLRYANLSYANLRCANLRSANLSSANLSSALMPNGEGWKSYLRDAVPALLTAGGRPLEEVATEEHWSCHDWNNCPMNAAFGIDGPEKGPVLLQPRIKEFVEYFDQGLIPRPGSDEWIKQTS